MLVKFEFTFSICLFIQATGHNSWKNYQPLHTDLESNANDILKHKCNSRLGLSGCTGKGLLCVVVDAHRNSQVLIPMGMAVSPKLSGV